MGLKIMDTVEAGSIGKQKSWTPMKRPDGSAEMVRKMMKEPLSTNCSKKISDVPLRTINQT